MAHRPCVSHTLTVSQTSMPQKTVETSVGGVSISLNETEAKFPWRHRYFISTLLTRFLCRYYAGGMHHACQFFDILSLHAFSFFFSRFLGIHRSQDPAGHPAEFLQSLLQARRRVALSVSSSPFSFVWRFCLPTTDTSNKNQSAFISFSSLSTESLIPFVVIRPPYKPYTFNHCHTLTVCCFFYCFFMSLFFD